MVMLATGLLLKNQADDRHCSAASTGPGGASGQPLGVVEPDDALVIDFGSGRERRIDAVDVQTADEIPRNWETFRVNVSPLSYAGRRELQGEGLVAEAHRVSRNEIQVSLCIDPTSLDVEAGRYQGKVRFDDPASR